MRGSHRAFGSRHRRLVRDRARDREDARRARATRSRSRGASWSGWRQRAKGLDATIVAADVSVEEDCARLVAEHVEAHGGLDVLVNSAGVGIAGRIGDTTTKAWDLQQSVNLRGAFLVTRAALPHLRGAKGYVVNLASIAGTLPDAGARGLRRVEGGADRAHALARSRGGRQRGAGDGALPCLRRYADGSLDRDPRRRDDRSPRTAPRSCARCCASRLPLGCRSSCSSAPAATSRRPTAQAQARVAAEQLERAAAPASGRARRRARACRASPRGRAAASSAGRSGRPGRTLLSTFSIESRSG